MNSRLTALGKFCVKVDDLSLGRPRTNTSGLELIPLEQVCPAHLLRSSGGNEETKDKRENVFSVLKL